VAERKVELESRIESMSDLKGIFSAMRGIAAARVQQGATTLVAVRSFAGTVCDALDQMLALRPTPATGEEEDQHLATRAVVVFMTEHGFVGGLNDNILREVGRAPRPNELFLLGTRGSTAAAELGVPATPIGPMSAHLAGVGEVADRTVDVLLRRFSGDTIGPVDVVSARRGPGGQITVDRRTLLPVPASLDRAAAAAAVAMPAITNLRLDSLLPHQNGEYLYARFVEIATESLVAESSARLAVLQSAHEHLDGMLESLRDADHRLRQDEITAEVLELVAGRSPSRGIRMPL
jgi:F-type H+-transporting ATPase subunit gamma